MTYFRKNVSKPTGSSPGASAPKDPNVTIVAVDDILVWPMRDGNNVNHVGNFVMKPGAKMIQLYMTPSKIKAGMESDGDEDAVSFKHKFEGEHPGTSLDIAEFVQNWTGVNAIVIYGSCADNYKKIMGTKCAPLQLKPSVQDDNEARKHVLVFEQFAKSGFVPGHYTGSLSYADPFAPASVAGIVVNSTNGTIYKLPALGTTAAITFNTIDLPHGTIITLVGQGGTAPATLSSGSADKSALLYTESQWVALENATINLKVFDAGTKKFLIEESRN